MPPGAHHAPDEPPSERRTRAPRLDPDVRRGLIIDAAESLLATHDPLTVTFDEVATAAGVSRALVHNYIGDRRGLVDAVQVRIIARLDSWVGHGLKRADSTTDRLRSIFHGTWSFVESEYDAWNVLGVSGGLDHPALHGVRHRWAVALSDGDDAREVPAQVAVSALVFGIGGWTSRGIDPDVVLVALTRLVLSDG